jgi:hypothetical protein
MNSSSIKRALEISHALFDPNSSLNHHISIAFYKNKVVGIGQNCNKTDPTNLFNRKFNRDNQDISGLKGCCSEASLFKRLKNMTNIPFNKINIINIRINRNKEVSLSKPCSSCQNLIKFIEPKSLWFSNGLGGFDRYI